MRDLRPFIRRSPRFSDNYSQTLIIRGTPVSVAIWDTAGGDDYDRLRPLSYPATHLFLICADQSAPMNQKAMAKWQEEYTHRTAPSS